MNLKSKLTAIKDSLFSWEAINRDYEFEAEFEDHPLGEQNVYRLRYVNYHRIGENYGMGPSNLALVDLPFQSFMLPNGMSRSDAFKVLSYLTDYLEKNLNLKECSLQSVELLNKTLDSDSLGFTRLNIFLDRNADVIDLFTVSGRLLLFKESEYYKKYFEWYSEGVTLEEVQDIYSRCGREFNDIDLGFFKDEGKKLTRE